ncbi:fibrinogen-like protein 1 [Chanos chanos]|uniref:Fibrinogen-like protein 1 n=1 Tax=Chanos chanos TaxID=29144 RepID=A0A6J2WJ90_CHACN|nr:fibrinogen-like protein 1 [Chanos chanos]
MVTRTFATFPGKFSVEEFPRPMDDEDGQGESDADVGEGKSSAGDCCEEMNRLLPELFAQSLVIQQLQAELAQQQANIPPSPQPHTQYSDCSQVFQDGNLASGLYAIRPQGSAASVIVFCDMSDGGGWTVVQRRTDGSESFDRAWLEYKHGFGDLFSTDGEFWLGNDPLHFLTTQGDYTLRINMEDFDGNKRFAEYRDVKVGDEKDDYELRLGEYTGNAGDSLSNGHNRPAGPWTGPQSSGQGLKFSTYDHPSQPDDPECIHHNTKSGWWFSRCHSGNLNGHYHNGPYQALTDDGLVWYTWHGIWYSIKSVVMMIRPSGFGETTDKGQYAQHEAFSP